MACISIISQASSGDADGGIFFFFFSYSIFFSPLAGKGILGYVQEGQALWRDGGGSGCYCAIEKVDEKAFHRFQAVSEQRKMVVVVVVVMMMKHVCDVALSLVRIPTSPPKLTD
jgi:hypothetical protein